MFSDLVELLTEIGNLYECRQGTLGALCNTNEPYVVLGTRPPGARIPASWPGTIPAGYASATFRTEKEAVRHMKEAFSAYAVACERAHKPGEPRLVLYWRYAAPHMFMEYGGPKHWTLERPEFVQQCRVRARLILTSKPVVWADQRAYDAHLDQLECDSHGQQRQPPLPAR